MDMFPPFRHFEPWHFEPLAKWFKQNGKTLNVQCIQCTKKEQVDKRKKELSHFLS